MSSQYIFHIAHSTGLVLTSPVMEAEVTSSIPARSVPCILSGKLQAQLPECDTTQAIV